MTLTYPRHQNIKVDLQFDAAFEALNALNSGATFTLQRQFTEAFAALIDQIDAALIIVSFNDEGFLARDDAVEVLSRRGEVSVLEHDYKRYVGAQIGIYNPDGEKVGRPGRKRNKERLFVVETPALRPAPRRSAPAGGAVTPP